MDADTTPSEEDPTPPGKRRRKRWITGALSTVVIGGTLAAMFFIVTYDPAVDAVEDYLDALKDRDVDAALDVVNVNHLPHPSGDPPDRLLTAEALNTDWEYTMASPQGPADVDATSRLITVRITGAGSSADVRFTVGNIGHEWKLDDPFVHLAAPDTPLTYLDVNGVRQPAAPADEYTLFPGVYRFFGTLPDDVTVPPDLTEPRLLTPAADGVLVEPPPFHDATISGDLLADAQPQVESILAGCAEDTDVRPHPPNGTSLQHCPFELDESDLGLPDEYRLLDEGPVEWSIDSAPVFRLTEYLSPEPLRDTRFDGFEAITDEAGSLSGSGSIVGGTSGGPDITVDYEFECELTAAGFRSPLDENDSLTIEYLPVEDDDQLLVGPDTKSCDFRSEVV